MSIDSRIREGLTMIDSALPAADPVTAYDVVTRERRPPRPAAPRNVVRGLVAAAAVAALVLSGLVGLLHHARTPTDVRPGPATPWILTEAPVGSPYNPAPRRGMRMLLVSHSDFRDYRPAPVATAAFGAWSPDGRQLALAVTGGTTAQIWVGDVSGGSRRRAYRCSGCAVTGLDWSPDGATLAVTEAVTNHGWSLRLVSLATGQAQDALTATHELGYPRWSPSGAEVSVVETRGQRGYLDALRPAAGASSIRQVAGPVRGLESADWSPDGTQLAFTAGSPGLGPNTHADLYVVNSDGSGRHRVTTETSATRLADVEWEPHGTPFLVTAAIGSEGYDEGLLSTVTADGHLRPVGGTGIVPGVRPRLRP